MRLPPLLAAIVAFIAVVGGSLATIEGVWSLLSDDPLVPTAYRWFESVFPEWPRTFVILFWLLITAFSLWLLIGIYRTSNRGNEMPEELKQRVLNPECVHLWVTPVTPKTDSSQTAKVDNAVPIDLEANEIIISEEYVFCANCKIKYV